ncbi:MMPL family transporter [Acidithiobacillus ferrianus]|uniref:MMPL family transporter n=1 Tax=Acidithiobacillus ferrianus TaxID=2678518 RepID=UPI0034E44FD2
MSRHRWLILGIWLATVLGAVGVISHTQFLATLSEFFPRSPSVQQTVLNEQLRKGPLSRNILAGIEGGTAAVRTKISEHMVQDLRGDDHFEIVSNGNSGTHEKVYHYLFTHRYLLSPTTRPELFTVTGLREAIGKMLNVLATPGGEAVEALFPEDPTGTMMHIAKEMSGMPQPMPHHGVWTSPSGDTALLLLQTRFSGSDTEAQQQAINRVREAFARAKASAGRPGENAHLVLTGVGVISVAARNTIVHAAEFMSLISGTMIVILLLLVYRSAVALLFGLIPVISGIMVGIAAVSLGFGRVYDITLGFGTALIGEAVDYSIYFLVQSGQTSAGAEQWARKYWPTVRLGVATSMIGFASLLFSNLPGLSQLGLYAIAGLLTASVVTRFVLPELLPGNFRGPDLNRLGRFLLGAARGVASARWVVLLFVVLASGILILHRHHLWNHELSALSPVPKTEQSLYARLRNDMGIPESGYLLVVSGSTLDAALQAAEEAGPLLQRLQREGVIGGFQTPVNFLPSVATQLKRKSAIPPEDVLTARLTEAVHGLPVTAALFSPFVREVERERGLRPLTRAALPAGVRELVESMVVRQGNGWRVLLPVAAPPSGRIDRETVQSALLRHPMDKAMFIDVSNATNTLYSGYMDNAIQWSLAGVVGIVLLLWVVFRSIFRVLRILLPLVASVLTVAAGFIALGVELNMMNLIGLMLIVAVGSNYALFFDRGARTDEESAARTLVSLVIANMATVMGFGPLAFSGVPVLQAIGATVAPGVVLALWFSASLTDREMLVGGKTRVIGDGSVP